MSKERSNRSGARSLKVHDPFNSEELRDSKVVAEALLDCIKEDDFATFRELLLAHLVTLNNML